jgi:hypothetical protein
MTEDASHADRRRVEGRMLTARALCATGVATLMLSMAGVAHAQAPGYNNVTGSPVAGTAATPATGAMGHVGGDVPATFAPTTTPGTVPAPAAQGPVAPPKAKAKPRKTTLCVTRRSGTRVCSYKLDGRVIRRCTTRGSGRGRVRTCRSYDSRGRVTTVCTKRGTHKPSCRRVSRRRAAAGAAGVAAVAAGIRSQLSQGFSNPVLRPVVRFYHSRSTTGTKGWCTGTMVRRGLVLTAAHCLYGNPHDGNGYIGYYPIEGYTVVPADTPNAAGATTAPYGQWRVSNAFVPTAWKNNDGGPDWGLAVIAPDANGNYPGDYTGTYTATWNARFGPGERLYKVGYPSSFGFNTALYAWGGWQFFCDMTWDGTTWPTDPYTASSFALVTQPCSMNGGSSGGPVMAYFSDLGQWSIVGVNNRGTDGTNGFGVIGISFYLDDRFAAFWNQVIAQIG